MKTFKIACIALATASGCSLALAQKAGSFSASVGVTQISPSVNSGNLSAPSQPGSQIGITNNSQLTGAVNYMVTDNIAVQVPLSFGFKHDFTGAGTIAGVVKIAET